MTVVNIETNSPTPHHDERSRTLRRPLPAARHLPRHRDARRLPHRRQRERPGPRRRQGAVRRRARTGRRHGRGQRRRRAARSSRRGIGHDGPGDRQQADLARSRSATAPPTASPASSPARRSSAPTRCSGRWTTTTCAALTVSGTINSEFTIDGSSNVVSRRARRHPAAGRRHPGVQGRDRGLRRAGRPHRRRHREPGAQERHQRVPRRRLVLQPRRLALGQPVRVERAAAPTSRRATTTASAARSAARSSRTRRSSWARTRGCRTTRSRRSPTSVPTERMRNGDFSELLAAGVQIYNPLTGAAGQRRRHPRSVPGQRHPAEPAQPDRAERPEVLPAAQPGRRTPTRPSNYFVEQPWTYGYDFQMARVDHQWNAPNRTYVRWIAQLPPRGALQLGRRAERLPDHAGQHRSLNLNVALGHTAILAQRLVRRRQGQLPRVQRRPVPEHAVQPGRPRLLVVGAGADRRLRAHPALQPRIGQRHHRRRGRHARRPAERLQLRPHPAVLQPAVRADDHPQTSASHTVKVGYDWRSLRQTEINQGWRGGAYGFDSGFTRASATAPGRYGQGVASFMLGLPTNNSFIELRPEYDYGVVSHGVFVHDDWRVSDRLTLNLGVRYDLEMGMTEAREPQHARLRLHHGQPDPGRGRGALRGRPAGRRPAHRAAVRRPRGRRLLVPQRRRAADLGRRHATTSSRASASPTRSAPGPSSAAASASIRRRSRSRACPA